MLGNSEALFISRAVKSLDLESARPGLNSDSATYHCEAVGKKYKLREPQFPHLCLGGLGGAREFMRAQAPGFPRAQSVPTTARKVLLLSLPASCSVKPAVMCVPHLLMAPSFVSPSWWQWVWWLLLPHQHIPAGH